MKKSMESRNIQPFNIANESTNGESPLVEKMTQLSHEAGERERKQREVFKKLYEYNVEIYGEPQEAEVKIAKKVPNFEAYPEFLSVHRDATVLYLSMLERLGMTPDLEKMPSIMPVESVDINAETSFYRPKDNAVYFHWEHEGNGGMYAEELAHCIRYNTVDTESEAALQSEDLSGVDEFFGRLGEILGYRIAEGTDLERIFKKEDMQEWSQPEAFKELTRSIADGIENIEIGRKNEEEAKKNAESLFKRMQEGLGVLKSLLIDYNSQSGLNSEAKMVFPGEIRRMVGDIYSLKNPVDFETLSEIVRNLNKLLVQVMLPNESANKQNIESKSVENLVASIDESLAKYSSNLIYSSPSLEKSRRHVSGYLNHLYGYVAAELFVKQNPDWESQLPELFRTPSKEIYPIISKYGHNRKWFEENGMQVVWDAEEKAMMSRLEELA